MFFFVSLGLIAAYLTWVAITSNFDFSFFDAVVLTVVSLIGLIVLFEALSICWQIIVSRADQYASNPPAIEFIGFEATNSIVSELSSFTHPKNGHHVTTFY
ncbi:unnamed protein product [Cylicostephanus goldi]|uniref:Uncharacterized protein n=1 Tax=Cylicostephanus goldi TaxID=71465 RepID=A0A3P6QS63_CYLGO|nr:unnamed protein product [Cylicostephanus goldi]